MHDEIKDLDTSAAESATEMGFDLLTSALEKRDLTIRDDQYEYAWLLDAIRLCRERGRRFRLVDSGRFEPFQLEWLVEAGADLYTSSEVRDDLDTLAGLQKAARKGSALLAFQQSGPLQASDEGGTETILPLEMLGRDGVHIYVSNREAPLDFELLGRIAESCRAGGTRLVYYHHGAIVPEMGELVRLPIWMHLPDSSLREQDAAAAFMELVTSSSTQAEFVLFLKELLERQLLQDLLAAGVYVQFLRAQFDYRSPFKDLERAAAKRHPDFKAFYLYPSVML